MFNRKLAAVMSLPPENRLALPRQRRCIRDVVCSQEAEPPRQLPPPPKQACRTGVWGQTGSPLRFLDLAWVTSCERWAYSRRLSATLLTLSSRSAALR